MASIAERCELLADAFEAKGVAVRGNLAPGLKRDEILRLVRPLNVALPEELIQLYEWKNGHVDDNGWMPCVVFRDNVFISLERAVEQYRSIQATYGEDSILAADRIDVRAALPISLLHGSWDVVACGAHLFGTRYDHPVVRVFQGFEMYFHSIAAMLDTCTAWVSSPNWNTGEGLSELEEKEIWTRLNPGVFARRV